MITPVRSHGSKIYINIEDVISDLGDYQIFDVRYSLFNSKYGETEYANGHIPGAIFVDVDKEMSGPITKTSGRHPLPSSKNFVQWCMQKGISAKRPVLCYDSDCGCSAACRLWWMLDNLGIEAYVLKGGIQAYCALNMPLTLGSGDAFDAPVTSWSFRTCFTRSCELDDLSCNTTIIDVRIAARYASTIRPFFLDTVAGHMPGSYNAPFTHFFDCVNDVFVLHDETRLQEALCDLQRKIKLKDTDNFDNCVLMCGSGLTACIVAAIIRHMNMGNPKIYVGSWSQYSALQGFTLKRQTVAKYGMFMDMICNKTDNDKVDAGSTCIYVDGDVCEDPDKEVLAALQLMHVGEVAKVYYKSGRSVTITAASGAKQTQI